MANGLLLFPLFILRISSQVGAMDFTLANLTTIEHGKIDQNIQALDCRGYSDCSKEKRSCYCDNLCVHYDDCCINGFNHTPKPKDLTDVKRPYATCEAVPTFVPTTIWAVSKCPNSGERCYDEDVDDDYLNIVPVVDEFNITYRNAKCARCHGVSNFNYWVVEVEENEDRYKHCNILCDDNMDTTATCIQTFMKKECGLTMYTPSGFSARYCVQSEESKEISQQCSKTNLPISESKANDPKMYRNMDCCHKNGEVCTFPKYACWSIVDSSKWPGFGDYKSSSDVYGSTILFNLNQECKQGMGCRGIQYVGFKFDIVLRLISRIRNLEVSNLPSVICLLITYFEGLDDSLEMIRVRPKIKNLSENGSLLTLFVQLKSSSTFEAEMDMLQLKTDMENIQLMILIETNNGKLQVESIKTTDPLFQGFNDSETGPAELALKYRMLSKRFPTLDDPICMISKADWNVPYGRCNILNVTAVIMDTGYSDITYNCLQFVSAEKDELNNEGPGLTSNFIYINELLVVAGVFCLKMFS